MGKFKFSQRTALLVFEDEEYAGAEVRVRLDFPIGEFIAIQRLQSDPDSAEQLCRFLASILIDWNLEDEQGDIPATYEGVLRISPLFTRQLCEELVKAMQPSSPLVQPSPAGKQ